MKVDVAAAAETMFVAVAAAAESMEVHFSFTTTIIAALDILSEKNKFIRQKWEPSLRHLS